MAEIIFASGNGAYRQAQIKAYFEPFEKKTGIKVKDSITNVGIGRILQIKKKGTLDFDVATMSEPQMRRFAKSGALEAIDYDMFNKAVLDKLESEVCQPYGVGNLHCAYVLGYDVEKFPGENHPNSWRDFWDVEKFPGMRGFQAIRGSEGNLEQALLADGVPMDRLYPLDIERGFRSLNKIRPYVHTWWYTGDQAVQLLLDQAVVATIVWDTRMKVLKEFGFPVDFTWNEAALMTEYLVVPKAPKHYRQAMQFLNFVSQARPQAELTRCLYSAPTNKKAYELIDEDLKQKLCNWPENRKNVFHINAEWLGENGEKLAERSKKWMDSRQAFWRL